MSWKDLTNRGPVVGVDQISEQRSTGEISEQMSRMFGSLDLLSTVISELDQRIAPVLCAPSPAAKVDEKIRCPESALAQSMQEQEMKLRACINYLMNITERVRL